MNKALHIAKKLQLWASIKRLGEIHKEEKEFTQEYAKHVYANNDLDKAIECFSDLLKQRVKI